MILGFVGTGTITAAIVEGLNLEPGFGEIIVSPRNGDVAASLAARFQNVRIASDNQQVLDSCDTVVLAIRPQIADDVLKGLRFHDRHRVISLIAAVSLDYLKDSVAPAASVTRAVPLPSVARRQGPTAMFPPDRQATDLFELLGTAFELGEEAEFDVFTSATAVMSTYFAFAQTVTGWMAKNGVNAEKAQAYAARMLEGLSGTTAGDARPSFAKLAKEHQTQGGINEQVFGEVTKDGILVELDRSLDGVLARLRRGRGQ